MRVAKTAAGHQSRVQYIRMNRSVRDAVRMLSSQDVDALVVIDGHRDDEGAILGILTERDVIRAMAIQGPDILDGLVWMLANNDFATADAASSTETRLQQFCAHKTDHIAITDGFELKSVLNIWDCVQAGPHGVPAR